MSRAGRSEMISHVNARPGEQGQTERAQTKEGGGKQNGNHTNAIRYTRERTFTTWPPKHQTATVMDSSSGTPPTGQLQWIRIKRRGIHKGTRAIPRCNGTGRVAQRFTHEWGVPLPNHIAQTAWKGGWGRRPTKQTLLF